MKRIWFALVLVQITLSADLLEGNGVFTTTNIHQWTFDNTTTLTNFTVVADSPTVGGNYVQISKPDTPLNFQEGMSYVFNNTATKVNQISFYFDSTSVNKEDTNLRLLDNSTGIPRTALSFRCGYNGFVRVNENQVIAYYNSTVVNDTTYPIWTRADIFFDWTDQLVDVYLNQTYRGNAFFYDTSITDGVGVILLYGLSPNSVGMFKNISVCNTTCDGFSSASHLMISLVSMLMIFMMMIFI